MGTDQETALQKYDDAPASIASKGGRARATVLTPTRRSEIARKGAKARWEGPKEHDGMPIAYYAGVLNLVNTEVPCYVLSDGQRVIGRTALLEMLNGSQSGGDLEAYLSVQSFQPYIDMKSVRKRMVAFWLPEADRLGNNAKGLPNPLVIDICTGLVRALDESSNPVKSGVKLTTTQMLMAIKASMFLAACAKVGLDALVDEVTGYQYERAEDALQFKLNLYLAEEMRKWEKTFPDELWVEFARLTNWKKSIHSRPKYWGKLVMELVYQNLDPDVAEWLRTNKPAPQHGRNYHQWMSDQYGLKKLIEHIWMLIGVAKMCETMSELRDRMAELSGNVPIQLKLYVPRQEF